MRDVLTNPGCLQPPWMGELVSMPGKTHSFHLVLHELSELFSDCMRLISHAGELYAATAFREKILRVHITFAIVAASLMRLMCK